MKTYCNPDNDPRGPRQSVSLLAQGYRPNQMYEIVAPNGKRHFPPQGRCWTTLESEYIKAFEDGRITFGSDGNDVPRRKQFLSESKGLVPWSWWLFEEVGHTDEAKKEIGFILDNMTSFDTPKPVRLLERIVHIATGKDSIILDSFAGSGTTAHAVLNMNKQDGGHRKFILVEMMDYADTITAERVKRVISGYGEGKKAVSGTDGGFSFYELGEPLLIDGLLNPNVPEEKIREYVYYTETRQPMPQPSVDEKHLSFVRTHYPQHIRYFLTKRISEYAVIMSATLFNHKELLNLLTWQEIDSDVKLELLKHTSLPIRISAGNYEESVALYIVRHNFDESELSQCLLQYGRHSSELRDAFVEKALSQIDVAIEIADRLDNALIARLLGSEIALEKRTEFLIKLMSVWNQERILQTLDNCSLNEYRKLLKPYAGKTIAVDSISSKLLSAFQSM